MRPSWTQLLKNITAGVWRASRFRVGAATVSDAYGRPDKVDLATWSKAAPLRGRHASLRRLSTIRRRIVFTKSSSMRCGSRYLDALQLVTAERR
jgi:hypothetical protein